jgi:hypothetical protein
MIFFIAHEMLWSAMRPRFESARKFQKATRGRPHTGGQAVRTPAFAGYGVASRKSAVGRTRPVASFAK